MHVLRSASDLNFRSDYLAHWRVQCLLQLCASFFYINHISQSKLFFV